VKLFIDKGTQIFEHKSKKIYKNQLAHKNLRGVQTSVRMAQALGKSLGRGKILLGAMPTQ
jgi:hypothetical protein